MSIEPSMDGSTSLLFTGRIAGWSARHRWAVLVGAVGVLGGAVLLNVFLGVETNNRFGAGESLKASSLIRERFERLAPSAEFILFSNPSLDVDDPSFRSTVEPVVAELRSLEGVASVASFYDTGLESMVSSDRRVLMVRLEFQAEGCCQDWVISLVDAVEDADREAASEGFEIAVFGGLSSSHFFEETLAEDFNKILLIALVGGLIILVLAFGTVVAAIIPLVMAVTAIFMAIGMAVPVSRVVSLNFYYYEMVLLMGLAVGIDYSLFVVNRFREERAAGRSKLEAIQAASNTTGRAVFYAGITVVVSLVGLLFVGDPLFTGLGLGAIMVVLFSIAASLTLLPALLSLLGDGINRLRVPGLGRASGGGGVWGAITDTVLGRPLVFAAVTLAGLIALSVPLLSLHIGSTPFNSSTVPDNFGGKRGLELLEKHFTLAETDPLYVIVNPGEGGDVNAPGVQASVTKLIDAVGQDEAFSPPFETQVNAAGDLLLLRVPVVDSGDEDRAADALHRMRGDFVPEAFDGTGVEVLVTGGASSTVDGRDNVKAKAPIVFGFVLGFAFLLLLVMFRSIIIPVKAILLNLLSVSAAYGVLVLVFQEGIGEEILDFQATGVIETFMPLFLFAVLFGLSMDYHMLLLSRVKEAYDRGYSNEESVSVGVRATAAVITSAAAIMVLVFGAFALSGFVFFKQVGVGLGVAVLIDATVIRVVLLPASMKLLGDWNWYLPSWLNWLPRFVPEGVREARVFADD